jgi:carboxypeptidase C (cathepsin A)
MNTSSLYRSFLCAVLVFGLSFTLAQAQSHMHKPKSKKHKKSVYPEKDQTSTGSVKIEGQGTVNYKAVAGTIPIFNSDRDTTAHLFFVGYFKKGVKDVSQRPVTFLYNGGPGSASVWLHMGSFGPKRVNAKDTVHISGAPYELENNNYSLLDVTDLVFIDAPGTGFSRLTKKGKPDNFYGVYQDANAFAKFIEGFLSKYGRWNSPKYLFGESYGTTRNAVLSSILTNRMNIDLNGVIMLSQILNFGLSIDGPKRDPGNYLPYVLGLPTYAATAWYHHKLPNRPSDLKSFIQKVEQFAKGPYSDALAKGSELSKSKFNQIAQKMHQYTGLSVNYLKKANLRVEGSEFEQNLLLDSMRTTGRLDTRFRGPTMNPLAEGSRYDPQSANISSAYISLFNNYVRKTLHFGKHMHYRPSHYGNGWSFKYHGRTLRNVMPYLARAMIHNPRMKVMLNTGYYDLATPFSEGIYELQHLPMPQKLEKNISYKLYKSGHMVYVKPSALKKLRDNVAAFIKKTDNVKD